MNGCTKLSTDAFLVWHPAQDVINSTSAGVFYCIANRFLNLYSNSVVYGCELNKYNEAMHVSIRHSHDLKRLQGSKYVQSYVGNCYRKVKEDLDDNCMVLFSGTGCQVAGLKGFLKKDYARLFTIDLVCHGVPSPLLFKKYILSLERKYRGKVGDFRFRNKSTCNRHGYVISFTVNGKKILRFAEEDGYYSAFINSLSLRPSCYQCNFVGNNRRGDISLGDSASQAFHPTEAVSLVLLNSAKGKTLLSLLPDTAEMIPADLEDEVRTNHQLATPSKKPDERSEYYKEVIEGDKNWIDMSISLRSRFMLRVKNHLPTKLKMNFKKCWRKN